MNTILYILQCYGVRGEAVVVKYFMVEHLSVAHFVAGPRAVTRAELRCSRAHCASTVEVVLRGRASVLRFLISVPCLSQSHRMAPPTSISARRRRRRVQILQELSWSTASKSFEGGARVCG